MAQNLEGDTHLLSAREEQVASLIASGCTNGEIAERLGIRFSTAKWYVSEVIAKLGVESREEVAARWTRERSLGTRLRRLPAAILTAFSFKPVAAVLAGAVLCLAGVALLAALASTVETARRAHEEEVLPVLLAGAASTAIPPDPSQSRVRPAPTGLIRLADLDGDPSKGFLSGMIDPDQGLVIRQHDSSGVGIGDANVSLFRDWELFIAAAGTIDGLGGLIAVGASDRVDRIDIAIDGGSPSSITPEPAPPALGFPLRVTYITVGFGRTWEFRAYDAADNYLGTVAHGSSVGAGASYVERGRSLSPTTPRLGSLDADSNGHVLRVWPADGAVVPQPETAAAPAGSSTRTGVCASVTEQGRGPDVGLSDFQFMFDGIDVTGQLAHSIARDPLTAASATLCFAPTAGLAPGRHEAAIMIHSTADRTGGYLGVARWSFEVVAR